MPNLRDNLTYADLGGKRKLRRYVIAALLILIIAAAVSLFSQFQRSQARADVFAPPKTVTAEAVNVSNPPAPLATEEPTPAGCPDDPAQWIFQDIFPGENLKRIAPDCVYEGLARTVAWHMLERIGYSKPEAMAMLGFEIIPYQPVEKIQALTSLKGPLDLTVAMEWGPHPDYRYWTLDADGHPGLAYALQGCYRAHTVTGNQVEAWGPYPVHCLVAVDYLPGWTVHELGKYRYAANWTDQPGARTFVLFAYAGAGLWVLIGDLPELYVAHDQLGGDLTGDREATAARHGLPVWDAHWLLDIYGFSPHPLQENWQAQTDPAALEPMGAELNKYVEAP